MKYLIDTNVISEFRKAKRADPNVLRWIEATLPEEHYTSVLVIGEIRHGIELMRRRDAPQAQAMELWLSGMVARYAGRILPIDQRVADAWGRLGAPDPVPEIDGLLAATALVHDMTMVSRDNALLSLRELRSINPFEPNRG